MKLKKQHSYYWQVQGQLLLTGMDWCDFVVFAEEDMVIQRIYKDPEVAAVIREKGDFFFFYFYLLCSLKTWITPFSLGSCLCKILSHSSHYKVHMHVSVNSFMFIRLLQTYTRCLCLCTYLSLQTYTRCLCYCYVFSSKTDAAIFYFNDLWSSMSTVLYKPMMFI